MKRWNPSAQEIMKMQSAFSWIPRVKVGASDVDGWAYLAPRMEARGYRWVEGVEKFADPTIYACGWQGSGGAYSITNFGLMYKFDQNGNVDIFTSGLSYLSIVPPIAKLRVYAMKARVESLGHLKDSQIVKSIVDTSAVSMRKTTDKLYEKLSSEKGIISVAESLGLPISDVLSAKNIFENATKNPIISMFAGQSGINIASLLGELKDKVGDVFVKAFSDVTRDVSEGVAGTASSLASSLADVASTVTAILPVVKMMYDQVSIAFANDDKAQLERCKEYANDFILKPIKELADTGFPIPMHVLSMWSYGNDPLYCPPSTHIASGWWDPDIVQAGAAWSVQFALIQSRQLLYTPPTVPLKRWWSLLQMTASKPLVEKVLNAMGRQRYIWSSDEHVLTVGVVVAESYGLDPWRFCEQLWGYSHGWWQYREEYGKTTGFHDFYDGALRGECVPSDTAIPPDRRITNAWILNQAAIAACAFALAEEITNPSGLSKIKTGPAMLKTGPAMLMTSFGADLDSIRATRAILTETVKLTPAEEAARRDAVRLENLKRVETAKIQYNVDKGVTSEKPTAEKNKSVLFGAIGSVALFVAGAPALAVAAPVLLGFYLASRVKTT